MSRVINLPPSKPLSPKKQVYLQYYVHKLPFQGPKSLDFQGPPLPIALVMDFPHQGGWGGGGISGKKSMFFLPLNPPPPPPPPSQPVFVQNNLKSTEICKVHKMRLWYIIRTVILFMRNVSCHVLEVHKCSSVYVCKSRPKS
jgi:hypothetical protein